MPTRSKRKAALDVNHNKKQRIVAQSKRRVSSCMCVRVCVSLSAHAQWCVSLCYFHYQQRLACDVNWILLQFPTLSTLSSCLNSPHLPFLPRFFRWLPNLSCLFPLFVAASCG